MRADPGAPVRVGDAGASLERTMACLAANALATGLLVGDAPTDVDLN
ncbi:MAG: hypothetical protein NZ898_06110 [Myxococcota bacterium]|nr:hypothetical protein [Myxococcota bacterium]MDW8362186.1 hypothetical protein [Myxococcales bacterium]